MNNTAEQLRRKAEKVTHKNADDLMRDAADESQYTVEHWGKHARNLVDAARRSGFIVRIDQVSDGPPAIANHRDVVTVYEARK